MEFRINAAPIVEGTPVGRNCPLWPTQEELGWVWNVLTLITQELGPACRMVETLQASFRQAHDMHFPHHCPDSDGRYLNVELKAALVVPGSDPVINLEVKSLTDTEFSIKGEAEAATAAKMFKLRIRSQIQEAIKKAQDNAAIMVRLMA